MPICKPGPCGPHWQMGSERGSNLPKATQLVSEFGVESVEFQSPFTLSLGLETLSQRPGCGGLAWHSAHQTSQVLVGLWVSEWLGEQISE